MIKFKKIKIYNHQYTMYNWNIVESGIKHHNPNPKIYNSWIVQDVKVMIVFPPTHITVFRYV
jgi:hypothetical protein